ncbi:MAG TPA: [Fe-Fe] hydrogenase large subunit C-terminal domain-containing protein [Gemmatimonadaceae bacterium]|nr:[Fe-Fe] hydrogenase large subunit C-terminal domain-containing protein [Gemmatimonadaceae bacterium]
MTAPAVVILGNDALLAARPATPVQLAHACLAAGYRAVVPASWGDELVAAATLQLVGTRAERPIIQCACPHVARRVLAVGSELAPYLASVVAPPVAAARYVRRHSSGAVRITYVGRCPAAADDSIDARLTPEELLAQLADRGIELLAQPTIFESVIPPDRRRHLSLPGGVPSDDALRRRELAVETIAGDDLATEVAEKVLSATKSLLDVAPAVGCACAGAAAGPDGRAAIAELEPPRAPSPVVDVSGAASLELPVTIAVRSPLDVVASPGQLPAAAASSTDAPPASPVVPAEPVPPRRPRLTPPGGEPVAPGPIAAAPPPSQGTPRRRSTSVSRIVPGPPPVASDQEGRLLPRTYVARRRSPRAGIPVFTEPPPAPTREAQPPAVPPAEPPLRPVATPVAPPAEPPPPARLVAEPRTAEPRTAEEPMVAEQPVERNEQRAAAPLPPPPSAGRVDRAPAVGAGDLLAAAQGAARAVADRAIRGWRSVRANPRVTLALLLGAAGLLIGVAIGWAAARHGAGAAAPNAVEAGQRIDAESAGRVAAPRVTPQRQIEAPAQAPARRSATRRPRGGAVTGTATAPATSVPPPAAPVAEPTPVAVDSAAERAGAARRDSVQRSTARADSLAAEREAIARELELRRARLDSLARRVGELSQPPATRPATPPAR